MRIAIFSDNFYPELSGIPDSLIPLAEELIKLGHQIDFYAPKYSRKDFERGGREFKELDLGPNMRVVRLASLSAPMATQQSRVVIPLPWRWLKMRKDRPDIIFTHQFFGVGIEALLAAKFLKVPLIGTNHTSIAQVVQYSPGGFKWVQKLFLRYATWYYNRCLFVTAPSRLIIEEMLENGLKRPHAVVPNPIDLDNFTPVGDRDHQVLKDRLDLPDPTIISVSGLAPWKRIDVIIRAMALVRRTIPADRLVIVGHGAEREALERLVKELDLGNHVSFLGSRYKKELAQTIQASEIFINTSPSEAFSMTIFQAMACGRPVIGVRARALAEFITDKNGALVEPGDHQGLAQKIIELLNDPEKRKQLGKGGIETADRLAPEKITKRWEEIFTQHAKKKLKMSVVIPAYNEEAYLQDCLKSVFEDIRGYEERVEIIVVNNASTDRTGEIASSFPGVKVVDEPRKGLPRARQAGYQAAAGDLIANIDADNRLPRGWTEKVMEEFSGNPKLAALSGPFVFYDLSWLWNLQAKFFYFLGYLSYLISHFILRKGGMLQGGNFIIRKSALDQIGGFDENIFFYGEDTDVARRLQKTGLIKFTFGLPIFSSGRRLKNEGSLKTGFIYIINYLWVFIFKKPFHKDVYIEHR